ncbi:21 kDa protein [Vitis vinifera]|uniref:21 kDa protein n=1 Tax=Vitis vinifera TaxID=29760 RepID=A0A438DXM9_VITVI|nr:21 kDa protein [Vitis vinifera]
METPPCTRFLSALLFSLAFTSINLISAARPATNKACTEFIRTACGTTTYPQLCFTSLAAHASVIQTNPKLLASTALSVTLSTVRSTSSDMSTLLKRHGLTPREVSAMRDCVEDAALTDEDTCANGFTENAMTENVGTVPRFAATYGMLDLEIVLSGLK